MFAHLLFPKPADIVRCRLIASLANQAAARADGFVSLSLVLRRLGSGKLSMVISKAPDANVSCWNDDPHNFDGLSVSFAHAHKPSIGNVVLVLL